jgi:signal peptidase II
MRGRQRCVPILLLISVLVVVLDRWTKNLVVSRVELGHAVDVIPNVFRISHVLNDGAAFSMFADSASPEHVRWALVSFSLVAAAAVLVSLFVLGRRLTINTVALALVLGGAVGNVYDRIRFASVVDFLEIHIVHYHWPDFNVADSAIVVGACLLMLDALWVRPKAEVLKA